MKIIKTICVMVLLSFSSSTFAFSNFVHELICNVAYDLLPTASQDFVDKTMDESNFASASGYSNFGEACVWPDAVRNSDFPATKEYHYINVPEAEVFDVSRDCAAADCVTQAVRRYVVYLNEYRSPPSHKKKNRKQALLFLGHFVGDMHQPLHVGNAEDIGGNAITVFTSETDQNANTKLHAVWDSNIGKKLKLHHNNARANMLTEINSQNRDAWRTLEIDNWANEAFQLARSTAYQFPNGDKIVNDSRLNNAYYDAAKPPLKVQVMKAAVRLAFLIDLAAQGNIVRDQLH